MFAGKERGDVRKPALMRALFRLGAVYSAQELSYNKMLGQLQDAGNTRTLAHCKGASLVAVEVKSGHETAQSGMAEFLRKHSQARRIVVGGASQGACAVEELLLDKAPLFGR